MKDTIAFGDEFEEIVASEGSKNTRQLTEKSSSATFETEVEFEETVEIEGSKNITELTEKYNSAKFDAVFGSTST